MPTVPLRPEYNLPSPTARAQGKYCERARAGSNLVLLEPEIAEAFPDSKAGNEALELLLRVARSAGRQVQARSRHFSVGKR